MKRPYRNACGEMRIVIGTSVARLLEVLQLLNSHQCSEYHVSHGLPDFQGTCDEMIASRNIDPLVVWITARMNDEHSLSLLETMRREHNGDSLIFHTCSPEPRVH